MTNQMSNQVIPDDVTSIISTQPIEKQEPTAVLTASMGATYQPKAYTSIRVDVSIPVFLQQGDDYIRELGLALDVAQEQIHQKINEECEEGYGIPAPFGNEPRGYWTVCPNEKLIVIGMGNGYDDKGWKSFRTHDEGHRFSYIRAKLESLYDDDYQLYDLTAGDEPPEVGFYQWYWTDNREHGLMILVEGSPRIPNKDDWGWWSSENYKGFPASALRKAKAKADEMGYTLYNCLDGDFSCLPAPPEPEPEPEYDNQDDYYDDMDDDDIPFS